MKSDESQSRNSIGETKERELIRRLASYIDASSLSNTDHWRLSGLRREAAAYLTAPRSEQTQRAEWLIWSNEHRAWWGPKNVGYPKDIRLAGRYTLDEARKICDQRSWDDLNTPPETMIHETEAGFMPESNERSGS